jgi:hypothetical protein
MRSKLGFLVLLLLLPTAVFAQDDWRNRRPDDDRDRDRDRDRRHARRDNAIELTPFAGYTWGGTIFAGETRLFRSDANVAANPNFGAIFGIPLSDTGLKLELMATRQVTELERDAGLFDPTAELADIDITYYHAGLQIPFGESRAVQPFAVVSAGIANLAPDIAGVSSESVFSASAGGGVKVPLSRGFSLRAEGRGYYAALEDDNDDCAICDFAYNRDFIQGQFNLGLVFSF